MIRCFLIVLGLAVSGVGFGQKAFVGTYEVIRYVNDKKVENAKLPPGQVTWLELKKDGKWVMRDMMVGFEGTWRYANGNILLTFIEGPAGKLKQRITETLRPNPDYKLLVLSKNGKRVMDFRNDPAFLKKLAERAKGVGIRIGK